MIRLLREVWCQWRADRDATFERLHITRHPDGNVEVHGASMRAVLRWYGRQHWASEWGRP